MSNLSIPELFKYEWRIEQFIKKYTSGDKFKLVNGRVVTLKLSKDIVTYLKKRNRTALNKTKLVTTDEKIINWTDLKKTDEFGGEAKLQDKPHVPLNYKEAQAFLGLRNQIETIKNRIASPVVPIKIGNVVYNVFGIENTPGTPKSDFNFIDIQGKPIAWISHKDGRLASDFQQWGGVSPSREPTIYASNEVKSFIKIIKTLHPEGIPPKTHIIKPIRSRKLKAQSIYGSNFGMDFSENNVNLAVQGEIRLKSWDRNYFIIQANHILNNGKIPTDDYEPVLAVTYKSDRSNFDIVNARFGIFPIGSQKPSEILQAH